MNAPTPDLDQARRFLGLLDPEAEGFTFQCFDDSPLRRGGLARVYHGPIADEAARLLAIQARGAGVFVTVNATDGMGRKVENIVRVRAVFTDLDGAPLDPVLRCALEPQLVVESSPERWHCYWLVEDLPLDQFQGVQKAIAARFGGDAACTDLPRVLRLPGFVHQKAEPFVTRITHVNEGLPYTAAQILAEFPPVKVQMNGYDHAETTGDRDMAGLARRIMTGEEYHAALRDLAYRYVKAGMAPGQVVETLRGLMDARPEDTRDDRWKARREQIPMLVSTAEAKLRGGGDTVPPAEEVGEMPCMGDPNDDAFDPDSPPEDDEQAAPARPNPAGARIEIKLSEAHVNPITRRCARLLRKTIFMRGPIPRVLARAESAGGSLIEDRDGAAVEIAGVRHRPGALLFIDATADIISWHLDERVLFWKFDKRSGEWVPASCPPKIAQRAVGAATELGFRACAGFVRTPLFIDGAIITMPGWHRPTGLILDLNCNLPTLPAKPTKEDAARALEILLRPFRGYLNDNPELRPAIAAAALTAVLRASLPAAPAIMIDGNTIGAGKGKLARALSVLATGGVPAIITEGFDDQETEKRIASAVLQGSPAILLDNLQRTVASTTLESILTESVADVRVFGKLTNVQVACRALVMMTANNAALRRDMLRRTLPVRIAVPDEKPELRRFGFDPVDEARRDRAQLLAAAFTIAKAWHVARSRPENTSIRDKTLGSFEAWSALVAGAVEWVTGTSPIDIVEARKDEDPAAARERAVIAQLVETFGDGEFTAANAAAQIEPAIWREVMNFKGERPDGHGVGNWLRKRKDRTFSVQPEDECHTVPVALESGRPDRNGVVRWWFRGAGTAGTCGYTSTQPRESGSDISGVRDGNDPACTSSTRTSEPDGADAGIPFMITEAMKAALRARGWTEAGIRSLKPEQAHNILRGAA